MEIANTSKMELKTFTPEEARRLLGHYNNANRPKKSKTITGIARDLKEGRYTVNGETIKFAPDGTLLDSQNRLEAVVLSGVSMTTWVAYGIDKSAFDTIDVGMPRTGGDILYTQNEKHTATLAGALNFLGAYEDGRFPNGSVSKNRLRSLLENYPTMRESVSRIADHEIGKLKFGSKSMLSFLHYMFLKIDSTKATEFFDGLERGEMLQQGSPILLLRNQLTANAIATKKIRPSGVLTLCLKAWDAYLNGRSIQRLALRNNEQVPRIAGLENREALEDAA